MDIKILQQVMDITHSGNWASYPTGTQTQVRMWITPWGMTDRDPDS